MDNHRFSWMGAAFAVGLAATGCGSSDDSKQSTGDDASSPDATTGAQQDTGIGMTLDGTLGAADGATLDAFVGDELSTIDAPTSGSDATSASDGQAADVTTGGDDASTCRPTFASGVNVAWINYASDVPVQSGEIAKLTDVFTHTYAAGGRVVRWWFHTNGTKTPIYGSNGMTASIASSNDIADVKMILDAAHSAGVGITISLWGFNMLQGVNSQTGLTQQIITNNMNLLTMDTYRQAYIDNYLTPLVTALKGYPGLYAWEIFNEPEGMTTTFSGWATNLIDGMYIQKTVNWFAAAIHAADSNALVTNGAWTFQANATVNGWKEYYSDANLMAVGGKAGGTLDFYEVHYYNNYNGANVGSPFLAGRTTSYWKLSDPKPIDIGEFWAVDTDGVAAADLYTTLYTNGYSGAWAWQYENADNPGPDASTVWPAMQVPMQNLYTAHQAALTCP